MPCRIVGVSLACGDPGPIASFYLNLLGGRLLWNEQESAGVCVPSGLTVVAQRVAGYVPPAWQGLPVIHFGPTSGTTVTGLERRALSIGARLPPKQPGCQSRILLDPAGHPFSLAQLSDSICGITCGCSRHLPAFSSG
ncbi:VOC family protein [Nocardia sp. NPDC050710]|uniref:VOC family protein n=1 Tax=Nocardia sp. NPDC050710 TaxID=3157220 RepID=UPI0033EBEC1F